MGQNLKWQNYQNVEICRNTPNSEVPGWETVKTAKAVEIVKTVKMTKTAERAQTSKMGIIIKMGSYQNVKTSLK